ncbi:U-box domain-containing protein 33 isoform X2 [Sorghum bicolor]|uniref:U-box domain-containing protein 33 isoform X2 n=1 Tax=Sorghum bicolor TaxID=4558 RepID=UPI000B426335|nr:U-box domain-containing protein 33 isoform X2 [Sorghum bicolor]|eukprot:XP_021313797.1 U-box domain-containing protein 33 isoform X2 [Sorghum bicolor]
MQVGAWVPVSQLAEEEVAAYRQLEEERIAKVLDDLLAICQSQKVNASKIIIASDDIARGLVQLVDDHGVTELVMGAASDRAYGRKMRAPRSKKALTVQQKANPSCRIWFVCRGNLICTRDASEGQAHRAESSTASTSPRTSTSDCSRSKSSPCLHSETFSTQETDDPSAEQTHGRDLNIEDSNNQATTIAGSSAAVHLLQEIQEDREMPASDGLDAGEMDDALYEKLKHALMEAENLKQEAYEETRRRQMAERGLAEASRMADEAERSYQREARHRKEVEEMVARERAAMEQDKRELDGILDQIRKVDDRSAELELQITTSEHTMNDLEARLSESYNLLDTLRHGHHPCNASESASREEGGGEQRVSFLHLGYSELDEATKHFDESVRIDGGGGSRGKVYRGELRNMSVAVKVVDRDVAVDEARFARAVEGIARARHPNVVTLVGACPAARAVVYELVPGGSLEERLGPGPGGGNGNGNGSGSAPPSLPWHARCGVAYGACSALAFLHSTLPRATVHGDVRPANILVVEDDARRGWSCKLAGLGERGLVEERARPGGAGPAARAYADPRYLAATGELILTPHCDVYALGVVLLRLVTGRPAFLARKAAREAAGGRASWQEVAAGGWPTERAREVALLGLRCCGVDVEAERRPRLPAAVLLEEARGVLEAAMSSAPSRSPSSLSLSDGAPSYFLCPILKEVMRDPQIAGDGFTYEAEAIGEWLCGGHDTSPMTNLKLPTRKLVPNHALRSAIHEWRHRQLRAHHRLY